MWYWKAYFVQDWQTEWRPLPPLTSRCGASVISLYKREWKTPVTHIPTIIFCHCEAPVNNTKKSQCGTGKLEYPCQLYPCAGKPFPLAHWENPPPPQDRKPLSLSSPSHLWRRPCNCMLCFPCRNGNPCWPTPPSPRSPKSFVPCSRGRGTGGKEGGMWGGGWGVSIYRDWWY